MKRFAIIAFLLALGLLPHHLAAQSKDRTGVDLLEECQLAVSGDASTADKSMKATFCVGYLLGVLDHVHRLEYRRFKDQCSVIRCSMRSEWGDGIRGIKG